MAKANLTSDMFEPKVFQEFVTALEPARGLELYNSVKKDTTVFPYATWTQKGGRVSELAEYNTPNAKANLIDRGPNGKVERSATLAYMREGDYLTPTATLLLKDVDAGNDAAIKPAEQIVADQVKEINDRIDSRIEWSLWQAAQGKLEYTGRNVGTFSVDYGFDATHKIVLSTADQIDQTPTLESLISTIRNAKQVIRKDSGVDPNEVCLTKATMDLLIATWLKAAFAANTSSNKVLSDANLDEYYQTGTISNTNFMGINNWKTINQYYDVRNSDGQTFTTKSYVPHGSFLFMDRTTNNALKYISGPSADFDAPKGTIGRFAKNFTNPDPSGRQIVIEEMGLPVITAPNQFATVKAASDTWINAQTW